MAHGMVDVNVNYQDIVRLEDCLIELGKTDWTLASYPVEDHAFVRPSSWTDEYRRIFDLFERTIRPSPQPNTSGVRLKLTASTIVRRRRELVPNAGVAARCDASRCAPRRTS